MRLEDRPETLMGLKILAVNKEKKGNKINIKKKAEES